MQFINYLLFISILNLYNSFITINKKYYPNIISCDNKNKLNMGCDYYIDKDLHIYDYNDILFSYINLEHERGYYWFNSELDEDEDGYDQKYAKYIEKTLTPVMQPIIIYSNNTFHKLSFENKYKQIIDNNLILCNKKWNDVNKIVKIENRYER